MTEKEAIRRIKDHFRVNDDGRPTLYLDKAVAMAINALERQCQIKMAVEALHEKSAKYAEMYLETAPDTEDHILDMIKYRAAADIYANAANMVKVLLRGENDD